MNSCENLLFPGSVRRHSQEGRTLFLHLPVQDWSCCLCEHCVAQSKIRAKLGRGSSSVACLPQALFYIFIVQGQKRLLAVLKTEFWLGSPTPHPPPPTPRLSFLRRQRGDPQKLLHCLFSTHRKWEGPRWREALCSEHTTAGSCGRVPGTTTNP